jgi:hypothetical protein
VWSRICLLSPDGGVQSLEVFTVPHIFRAESLWTPWSPRTVLGLHSDFTRTFFEWYHLACQGFSVPP